MASGDARASPPWPAALPGYAELRCVSNFSFLRGASQPEELVERAKAGYRALALTDECSLAGMVRAHVAAKKHGLKLLVGSQFQRGHSAAGTTRRSAWCVLACNLQRLRQPLRVHHRCAALRSKGTYRLDLADIGGDELADCVVRGRRRSAWRRRRSWRASRAGCSTHFTGRCWLGVELLRQLDDEMWLHRLRQGSALSAMPLVAVGDVHMHVRSRKALQDVLTATRIGRPLTDAAARCSPTPSSTCAPGCGWRRPTPRSCWPRRCRWPSAAASRSTS